MVIASVVELVCAVTVPTCIAAIVGGWFAYKGATRAAEIGKKVTTPGDAPPIGQVVTEHAEVRAERAAQKPASRRGSRPEPHAPKMTKAARTKLP